MIFNQVEKDIAKQIFKIVFFIFIFFILFILLNSNFDNSIFDKKTDIKDEIIDNKNNIKNDKISDNKNINNNNDINKKNIYNKNNLPLSIEIPGYNINTTIESPASTDVKILDNALTRAAVYYPGSGYPGSNNMLIFGHSTSFKIVRNKAYQIFNNIKNIPVDTLIYVKNQEGTHIYKTKKVQKVSKYTAWIQFKSEKPMLTLATCDSFGKASDRWVLEAEYIGLK